MRNKATVIGVWLAGVALLTVVVWIYGFAQSVEAVAARGRVDLALASDRLVTQLSRYRETAVLTASHPALQTLAEGHDNRAAQDVLQDIADKTSALSAFYVSPDGKVLARAGLMPSPDALRKAPYFKRALQGALGSAYGAVSASATRAYSFAAPSFGENGRVLGVLVVEVDIERLERAWSGARPTVYFTDHEGVVFVTNRSELVGWRRVDGGMVTPGEVFHPVATRQVRGLTLWQERFSPYIPARALFLEQPLPVIGLTGKALIDVAPAMRIAGLQAAAVAALCLFFGSLLAVAMVRRRALAEANVVLEDRVKARTRDLESVNAALRREVMERQEAEALLRQAQADLVQAGKLSALGQMSAGISHELNQPLMAIRQYSENGAALLEQGRGDAAAGNLQRITDMAVRAARIIRNLRAFARNEAEPRGRVDLCDVIDSAVELVEARLRADHVLLAWQRPQGRVYALGGEVRLSQVFVNLLNNAADAMDGQSDKRIEVTLQSEDGLLRVSVRDTGPGIKDPDRIFEPFYSTKAVGDGMGLGLSISYGLVQSFGGNIRGANHPEGGAVFAVELDAWVQEEDVA